MPQKAWVDPVLDVSASSMESPRPEHEWTNVVAFYPTCALRVAL